MRDFISINTIQGTICDHKDDEKYKHQNAMGKHCPNVKLQVSTNSINTEIILLPNMKSQVVG